MQIEAFRLHLTDQDLQELLAEAPRQSHVENLELHFTDEGLRVRGVALKPMRLPFEATCQLTMQQARVRVKLIGLQVRGFRPPRFGLPWLVRLLAGRIPPVPGLTVEQQSLYLDLTALLAQHRIELAIEQSEIRTTRGQATVQVHGVAARRRPSEQNVGEVNDASRSEA